MNNEPVAWIEPKELNMDVSTSVTKHKHFDTDIPLYTQPQKYCPSEDNAAYEKGFVDGMGQMIESSVHRAVEGMSAKTLTDEEIEVLASKHLCYQIEGSEISGVFDFARAILKKASEK
jgi:hypothetical protein